LWGDLQGDFLCKTMKTTNLEQGMHYTVGLAIYIKKYRKQKKNYGNSNTSPCQKYNLQKNPLKETKILQVIITL
jgi:hypothetical protein